MEVFMDYFNYLRNLELMNQMESGYDMSRLENQPWPLTFQNKSKQYLLSKSIEHIKEYVIDETEDSEFYSKLISLAPNEEQKKIIDNIIKSIFLINNVLSGVYLFLKVLHINIRSKLQNLFKQEFQ